MAEVGIKVETQIEITQNSVLMLGNLTYLLVQDYGTLDQEKEDTIEKAPISISSKKEIRDEEIDYSRIPTMEDIYIPEVFNQKKGSVNPEDKKYSSMYFIKTINILTQYSERLPNNKIRIVHPKTPLKLKIGKSQNSTIRYEKTADIFDDHCVLELNGSELRVNVNQTEKMPIGMGTFLLLRKFEGQDKEKFFSSGSSTNSDETVNLVSGDLINLLGLVFSVEIIKK
jgi:hypothetical protein